MTTGREFLVGVGLLALIPLPTGGSGTPRAVSFRGGEMDGQPSAAVSYSKSSKEFYMTSDEIGYIRPGFQITVNSITIPEDRRPVVDYSFTDDLNQPLDRKGEVTPGSLSINQVLAWWDAGTRHYTAYTTRQQTSAPTAPHPGVTATQAAADSGGTWTDVEIGHSIYKFKTVLPESFDRTKTHTLAVYATRNTDDIIGKNYYANLEHDFRPDGQAVTDTWDKTTNAACNNCHNTLSAHGGSRQDIKLCVTCHQPQTTDPDTGNTVDFKVMVHKIHRGEDLPSVQAGTPYVIWGNNSSIHDFSDVVFPQDIRNCVRCHTPEATQSHVWYTFPSRAACGSCHDNVNFDTGENHPAGPYPDDSQCASCHRPAGDREFDASVMGAHTVPYKSTQLKGLNAEILSVSNARPGQHPTVEFRITENDGTFVAPSSLGTSLNLLMGGPTTDYAIQPFREQAQGATVSGNKASYTFTNPIPADATGSWAFSIEARRDVAVAFPPPGDDTIREAAFNPIHYESVQGGAAAPRREVVDIALCNTCHDRLAFHGGQRLNTQECVMCHNPNFTDGEVPAESLDFKLLVHRLHRGRDLTQPYLDFNHLRFPGDLRDCATCHFDGTWEVPENARPGSLPTQTPGDWYSPTQPTAAACLGCHDSQSAAAHAFLNTAPFGESCAVCHGPGAVEDVDKVHAH
jgi:OmcA/MtrC family decaheme c-type cytochrome